MRSNLWSPRIQKIIKRLLDVVLGTICLVILSLPMLFAAIATKLDSKGPVFFRQLRVGRDGKTFRIWKFRTMIDRAEDQGLGPTTSEDDYRVTRIGRFLRDWGLDELPQLLNVIRGEMSIVGPRPTLEYQVESYSDHQRRRLLVDPGITSLAVVSGRNALPWAKRIELDISYVENWSIWMDLKIIVFTFWAVLVTRKGLYGEGGVNDIFVSDSVQFVHEKSGDDHIE